MSNLYKDLAKTFDSEYVDEFKIKNLIDKQVEIIKDLKKMNVSEKELEKQKSIKKSFIINLVYEIEKDTKSLNKYALEKAAEITKI